MTVMMTAALHTGVFPANAKDEFQPGDLEKLEEMVSDSPMTKKTQVTSMLPVMVERSNRQQTGRMTSQKFMDRQTLRKM